MIRNRTKEYLKIKICQLNSRCRNDMEYYRRRGIKNFLTFEDIKFLWLRDKGYKLKRPSLDRKNPDGHYSLKNCRFIEFEDNVKRARKIWHKTGIKILPKIKEV